MGLCHNLAWHRGNPILESYHDLTLRIHIKTIWDGRSRGALKKWKPIGLFLAGIIRLKSSGLHPTTSQFQGGFNIFKTY